MIQELFIYDRERGLFKEILNKSIVMQGRYHVSPTHGNDLNTNNLETYIKDPANGLIDVKQKYPICVCMTPRSRYVNFSGGRWEEFIFNLYFVCTTFRTGTNQIKSRDPGTNTSAHPVWYDWQDMKEAAMNFLEVLKLTLKKQIEVDGMLVPLRTMVNEDISSAIFNRLTKFNNDVLTGVSVSFPMYLEAKSCETPDYVAIDDIKLPPLNIHSANDD